MFVLTQNDCLRKAEFYFPADDFLYLKPSGSMKIEAFRSSIYLWRRQSTAFTGSQQVATMTVASIVLIIAAIIFPSFLYKFTYTFFLDFSLIVPTGVFKFVARIIDHAR